MADPNPMEEWQRLAEIYGGMNDLELERIANEAYQLTDAAREVLRNEIFRRRLDVSLQSSPAEEHVDFPESPYTGRDDLDSELDLAVLVTVLDAEEAARVEQALEYAGIAHFLGPENVDSTTAVTTPFANGVDLKVRRADSHRAMHILRHLDESNGSAPKPEDEENTEPSVHCPSCGSKDVVLENVESGGEGAGVLQSKYYWTCDSCEHSWSDNGLVQG